MEKKQKLFSKPTQTLTEEELQQASGGGLITIYRCYSLCTARVPGGEYYKNYALYQLDY